MGHFSENSLCQKRAIYLPRTKLPLNILHRTVRAVFSLCRLLVKRSYRFHAGRPTRWFVVFQMQNDFRYFGCYLKRRFSVRITGSTEIYDFIGRVKNKPQISSFELNSYLDRISNLHVIIQKETTRKYVNDRPYPRHRTSVATRAIYTNIDPYIFPIHSNCLIYSHRWWNL